MTSKRTQKAFERTAKVFNKTAALKRVQALTTSRAGTARVTLKNLDLYLVVQLAEVGLEASRLTDERNAAGDFIDDCAECDGKGWAQLRCNNCGVDLTEKNAPDEYGYRGDICAKCEREDKAAGRDRHGNPR